MSMIHINAEVSSDQLARVVSQLPPVEWERFLSRVWALRPPHAERVLSHEESALLVKINQGVPQEAQRRYDALIARRRANSLTSELCCDSPAHFSCEQAFPLKLKNWTKAEIQEWLVNFGGYDTRRAEDVAAECFSSSKSGVPHIARAAIERRFG